MLFLKFYDLNMIAMPNSHLVLHKFEGQKLPCRKEWVNGTVINGPCIYKMQRNVIRIRFDIQLVT